MNQPPIAILLPVYRRDTLVRFQRAVESLLAQDYPREALRIYLGVDGELDEEVDGYVERADCFYKIVRNKRNRGLAHTLNRLITVLEDEAFVFRMDADDESLPQRISLQVAFLQAHPEIDVVGGGIQEVDEEGREVFVRRYPTDPEVFKQYICRANPLAHPTVCFRREFFAKLPQDDFGGPYPERHRKDQDLALWFLALSRGLQLANLDQVLVRMLVTADLYARRGAGHAFSECAIYLHGIQLLHGTTLRSCYPLARLAFRLLPTWLTSRIYRGRPRQMLNK
jgi:glycosyltransferase involved in cell wall biosynthesis